MVSLRCVNRVRCVAPRAHLRNEGVSGGSLVTRPVAVPRRVNVAHADVGFRKPAMSRVSASVWKEKVGVETEGESADAEAEARAEVYRQAETEAKELAEASRSADLRRARAADMVSPIFNIYVTAD